MDIGGRRLSAKDHDGGVLFCKDLLAKRIVVRLKKLAQLIF